MATLTVVTTASQRIYTKYEENQAYYSSRSALINQNDLSVCRGKFVRLPAQQSPRPQVQLALPRRFVVTTASQRIYTKYEENQAYYSARSALDVFTQNMLYDKSYYAYEDSGNKKTFISNKLLSLPFCHLQDRRNREKCRRSPFRTLSDIQLHRLLLTHIPPQRF